MIKKSSVKSQADINRYCFIVLNIFIYTAILPILSTQVNGSDLSESDKDKLNEGFEHKNRLRVYDIHCCICICWIDQFTNFIDHVA